jgi:hypothetical protein
VITLPQGASNANAASGSYTFTGDVTQQEVNWIRQGRTYFNIHTAANGGGEIRGQIIQSVVPATGFSGVFNSNCFQSDATGTVFSKLCVNFAAGSGSATAASYSNNACTTQTAGYSLEKINYADSGASPMFQNFDVSWSSYSGAMTFATADDARRTAFTTACPTYTTSAPNVLQVAAISSCAATFMFSSTPDNNLLGWAPGTLTVTDGLTSNVPVVTYTKDAAATACPNYVANIPPGNGAATVAPSFVLVVVALVAVMFA